MLSLRARMRCMLLWSSWAILLTACGESQSAITAPESPLELSGHVGYTYPFTVPGLPAVAAWIVYPTKDSVSDLATVKMNRAGTVLYVTCVRGGYGRIKWEDSGGSFHFEGLVCHEQGGGG